MCSKVALSTSPTTGGAASPRRVPRRFLLLALALVHVTFGPVSVPVTAAELPDAGVSLGLWADATSTYFGPDTPFVLANGSTVHVPAPPLQTLALVDWQHQRRTQLLGSWPNQSLLTLWGSRSAAVSYAARIASADLVYRAAWTSAELPVGESGASREAVSAVAADLRGAGEVDVAVQASDGTLWYLARNGTAAAPALTPLVVVNSASGTAGAASAADAVVTQPKVLRSPLLSAVPDVLSSRSTSARTAPTGLAFVNAQDQLVLLSPVSDPAGSGYAAGPEGSPQYTARVLVDESVARGTSTGVPAQRVVLPLSVALADVNEDCIAELLYAVRDAQARRFEVYMLSTASVTLPAAASTPVFSSADSHRLVQLSEGAGEVYGEAFTLADVNGDGLPELLIPVQLAGRPSTCAAADLPADAQETCVPYHAVRVFSPVRAAGVTGAPTCASVASEDGATAGGGHLTYTLSASELYELTPEWCGVASWTTALPLYMPSYPSAPLLLRAWDYNHDRLADVIVPSSFGPLLLTSRAANGASPLVCTALDSPTGRAAVQQITSATSAGQPGGGVSLASPSLESYRAATPFFATLAQLGRAEVLLTHHRRAGASSGVAAQAMRVYENSAVPSRSYFLSASALSGRAYGAASVGATHHLTWQDINMHSHWATVTQLGQTSGHALLPGQVVVGLDETFSYVHEYTVGVRVSQQAGATSAAAGGNASVTQTARRKEWPSYLVPNAAVFAQLTPADRPHDWGLELYLPTSTYRALLVTALAVALVVIGLPVVWLRCGEMRRDFREWRTPL